MKLIPFDELRQNRYFWLYFLSVCFPLAVDENEETTLAEYIFNHYDCDGEAAVWVDNFVQYPKDADPQNGGYVENPTSIAIPMGSDVFGVQFHPFDTLFFHNGKLQGNTGGHYRIHRMHFEGFAYLESILGDQAVLLLPMVCVKEHEKDAAISLIDRLLTQMPFPEKDRAVFAAMILRGLQG